MSKIGLALALVGALILSTSAMAGERHFNNGGGGHPVFRGGPGFHGGGFGGVWRGNYAYRFYGGRNWIAIPAIAGLVVGYAYAFGNECGVFNGYDTEGYALFLPTLCQ